MTRINKNNKNNNNKKNKNGNIDLKWVYEQN